MTLLDIIQIRIARWLYRTALERMERRLGIEAG